MAVDSPTQSQATLGTWKMSTVPVDHVDLRIASQSDQNDGPHLVRPEDCGADQPYFHMAVDSPTQSHFEGGFPSGDSQSLNVAHHFDQIEKQFEDLQ
jgi:hypothetical protein